ncbi:MAG: Lrp/AsnC family transcriptional regulator [Flavobacteriales bacterium]
MLKNLDEIDLKIIKLLQENAKSTIKEMADQLNLSNTPVFDRIKRLEKNGVITGYAAKINRDALGLNLMTFCTLTLKGHRAAYLDDFQREVNELAEVVECYHLTGTFDYLLKVLVKDMADYQGFITKKLTKLSNIDKVQSSFVLTELKNETTLPQNIF